MSNLVTQVGDLVTARTFNGESTQILWKTDKGEYLLTSSAHNEWVSETLVFKSNKDRDILDFAELGVAGFGDFDGALENAGYTIDWDDE